MDSIQVSRAEYQNIQLEVVIVICSKVKHTELTHFLLFKLISDIKVAVSKMFGLQSLNMAIDSETWQP